MTVDRLRRESVATLWVAAVWRCGRQSGRKEPAPLVAAEARPGDMVLCLGAGTIPQWAHALPEALRRLG